MSASREKKKRQQLLEQSEFDLRQPKKKKPNDGGLPHWANWLIGIGAIAILVVFLAFIITTSNPFLNNITAVSVGGTKFSAGEAGYYYWDAVNTTSGYYGDYFQYFVDPNKSYSSQAYSEDLSWADYFMQTAETNMQNVTILYDEAVKSGLSLTAEQQQTIDESIATLEAQATENGWPSAEQYLKAFYGKAANMEDFEDYLTKQTLANAYYSQLIQSYEYSKDQIDSYYAEHKNDFDTVSFRMLTVSSSLDGMTADEAKAEAERIAGAADGYEATFIAEAEALHEAQQAESASESTSETETEYDADAATLVEDASYNQVGAAYSDWLFDEARLSGQTHVAEISNADGTTTFAVLYFLSRDIHDDPLVNVRHILIAPEDTSDTEAMAEAKTEAQELLEQWQAGEATEDSFAALAQEHSDDPGSQENGGLYENVYPGQMVEAFNDWCFDEARQVGDTGIVETDYGYHIMYFSGYSTEYDSYRQLAVDNTLRSNDYSDWYTGMQEQYPISEKFGILFVNK